MAQQRRFGTEAEGEDKKKVTRDGVSRTLRVFSFIRPYRGLYLLGFLFLILSTSTTLSTGLFIREVTSVLEGKSPYTLNLIIGAFFGLLVIQSFFSFGRIYFFAQVTERSMADLRRAVYSRIVALPVHFFEQRRVGELTSRIASDVSQLSDVLSITLAEFFRQMAVLIFGTAFICYLSWKLTLFMLATFPVLIVAAIIFGRFIRRLSKQAQDQLADANVVVEETFQSINVVKAFTNERFEIGRYSNALQKFVAIALRAANFRGLFVSFTLFALLGGIVGVLWFGGNLVMNHEMQLSDLISFIFYTGFIGGSVGGLGDMYAQIQKTVGASERILDILDETPEIDTTTDPASPPMEGNIVFKNVRFSYPSRPDIEVLKGVSLTVPAGRKIALVGPSGAGKSTIAQLLLRYYPVADGQITIDGRSTQTMNPTELRRNIAVVPQEVMLFGGTIMENIAYGKPNATRPEIMEAARKANALAFIESFPEGFDTIVGERGVKLSGGQRQRVAIARAILKDPAILVLDEATSSLDAESEQLVQEALDELMQNRTTIIIAHRLATIRKVDTIYVLRDGQIVETGTHDELADLEGGLYANLVRLQFELTD